MIAEGQILDGTYHLHRLIAQGGMGLVYEATHARLEGRYAIKVLPPALSENPEALERFHREARITSALQHPNVVQVVDHNTASDGTAYLVMEYLGGESLADRLSSKGRLGLESVVDIVEQLAAGLAAAHARGIVHRDLKPDNVYLVPVEGRETELVKILDFGISRIGGGLQTLTRGVCGTPQYMAPEQVEGRTAEVDGATDQFALAALTHELLTGRNPFMADNIHMIFSRVCREDPGPTGQRAEIDSVLARGMAKTNGLRFPSVTEFAAAFRAAAAVVVVEKPVASAPARRARRPRSRWGLGLSVAVAAGILAPFFVTQATASRLLHPFRVLFAPAAVAESVPAEKVIPNEVPKAEAVDQSDDQIASGLVGAPEPEPIRAAIVATGGRNEHRVSSIARDRRRREPPPSQQANQMGPPAAAQGASRLTTALKVDEDATMPPSDAIISP